jgi:GxxExxY protein
MTLNAITGAAIKVHQTLGAGLLESAYEACLEHELKNRASGHGRRAERRFSFQGNSMPARLDVWRENLSVDRFVRAEPYQQRVDARQLVVNRFLRT